MPARVSTVNSEQDLIDALGPRPTAGKAIVLVGGADGASRVDLERCRDFFSTLAEYLDRTMTAVLDGGTDSGVMRLIGTARDARGASFRLIGVAPRGALQRTTRNGAPIRLAETHPEILLVPGSRFGDEADWMFRAADYLADGAAPTLVINGGRLTLEEARSRLQEGHRVVTIAGSGRAADELAADDDLRASARLLVVPLSAGQSELGAALEA